MSIRRYVAPALIAGLYLVTRLWNLSALPIFNDEAFFIVTARKVIADPAGNLWVNFADGKEPLSFWFFVIPTLLFSDQLWGNRLFSALLGLLTTVFVYRFGGFWTAMALTLSPFLLVTSRLAVQENLLILLLTLVFYFRNRPLSGFFAVLALFTKTTAVLYLLSLVNKKNLRSFFIAGLLYLPIITTSVFTHNTAYAGFGASFLINLKQAGRWLVEYQGWPMMALVFFAPLVLKGSQAKLLWLLAFLPIVAEAAVAKIFFPRYFVFSIVPICLLAGLVIKKHKLAILVLIPNLLLAWRIMSDIKTAPLPFIEKWQYVAAWSAGYGVKETAEYLKSLETPEIIAEDVMIVTHGLKYYWPQANIVPYDRQKNGIFVFKMAKEIPVSKGLENIYNSHDVAVYRSYSGSQ